MKRIIQFLRQYWSISVVLLLSLPTVYPLVQQGFFSFHDIQHVARLYALDEALWAGQFPVRFVGQLGFGYGYALFNFYPPLTYYLGELYHLLGFGFIDSIKFVWGTALLGSALAMYLLARQFWGRMGAIISALFYLYIPYHAVDAYVRGALAELFSFVWLPLILLWSYKMLAEGKTVMALITGVFLALLMLTHNLIFLPFAGFYLLWCLALIVILRPKKKVLLTIPISLLVGFGLSAFFFIPALLERQYTLVDQLLLKNLATYTLHFVCLPQLWDSPWGFAGSAQGCIDGMSFKVGKVHLLASGLTLLLIVFYSARSFINKQKFNKDYLIGLASLLLGIGALFMTTEWSKELWKILSPLWYLQFPWRFLEFAALFLSFAAGSLVLFTRRLTLQILMVVTLVVLVIATNYKYFTPQFYFYDLTDQQATSDEEVMLKVSKSSFEFLPKGMKTYYDERGDLKVEVSETLSDRSNIRIANGAARNQGLIIFPDSWRTTVTSPEPTTVIFPIAMFPGWQATVDGQAAQIDSANDQRFISVNIPAGTHSVNVDFTDTPIRHVANLISLLTAVICLLVLYESRRSKKSRH